MGKSFYFCAMTEQMLDYFIVGAGLGGVAFAEVALQHQKSIFVFAGDKPPSSVAAAGVYNAVILKRFTLVSQAQEQINLLKVFYPEIEKRIQKNIIFDLPTYRRLASVEEQNNFIVASDRPLFQPFLSPKIISDKFKAVISPFGFGLMKQTGYVDTKLLLQSYRNYLQQNGCISAETFNYAELIIHPDFVEYKGQKARQIIFAEGFQMKHNPFFKDLPLEGAKGELLVIRSENLDVNVLLKAGVFVLPIGNDLYKVGATYNWTDKTNKPTQSAKDELISELKELISCGFEVVEHLVGIRPTVKDRKPLVGRHPFHKNIYLLNGLGTRGVMLAPYLSYKLFDFIESNLPLDSSISIERYYNSITSSNK